MDRDRNNRGVLVGVPTYRGAENGEDDLLGWCLRGIRLRSGGTVPYEIVVVDDSGRSDHQKKSRAVCDRFGARWLAHDENLGVSAAWNTLVRSGAAQVVALLNDDLIVSPGWLEAGTYFLDHNPRAASVGFFAQFTKTEDVPLLLAAPDTTVPPRDPFTKEPLPEEKQHEHHGREQPGRCMAPTGCGFMLRRSVYDLVGGFPRQVKSHYEESWLGTACAERGFASYALQWPVCYHLWSETFRRHADELKPDVAASRAAYVKFWGQHYDRPDGTHRRFMSRIPWHEPVRWLDPDGPREEVITHERQLPYAVNFGPPATTVYGDGSEVQCGIPVVVDVVAEDGTRHRITLTLRVEDAQQIDAPAAALTAAPAPAPAPRFAVRYSVTETQEPHPDDVEPVS